MSEPVKYSREQRLLEYAAIAVFALLSAWSIARLAFSSHASMPFVVLVAAPCGWLASDFGGGLAHFAFDTFGSPQTPLIGRAFIRPFREHHADPEAMTRHDFVETHGASCLAALPVLFMASLVPLDSVVSLFLQALLVTMALGALATNQCHKWAHMAEAETPRLALLAQRCHLVLPREHHLKHHTPPFDSHFCISSGWLNPAFDFVLRIFK